MAEAIFGRKIGMTQVFSTGGEARGVTVVEAGPCVVVQIKTKEKDGYDAIQLGFGTRKRVNSPMRGHLKKLGDFAVTYELNVYCRVAQAMGELYTELHRNILDVFNEYGVQIMTPAYEGDPKSPKVVERQHWYEPPAHAGHPERRIRRRS